MKGILTNSVTLSNALLFLACLVLACVAYLLGFMDRALILLLLAINFVQLDVLLTMYGERR